MLITIFEKICNQSDLGILNFPPMQLTGGFMHNMYSLFTTKGKYAVKLLNPYVMLRETAKDNFQNAEQLEAILEKNNIPILPALVFRGRKIQEINGQFFYIYDWYDGKALTGEKIKEYHCIEIGKILAKIHNINKKESSYQRTEIHIDWEFYTNRMKKENKELYELLYKNYTIFYDSQEKGNSAIKKILPILSICHNDMDTKNVLWDANDYRIIDLECLSYSSPFLELYELALCWSGYENCNIDSNLFITFIKSYISAGGIVPANWDVIYDSNYGRLEWLEYNMKRVLGMDCSSDEKETGISEVRNTVAHIVYYYEMKEAILTNLKQILI